MTMRRRANIAIACCALSIALVAATVPADAGTTRLWRTSSFDEFDKGELKGTVVVEPGTVSVGLDSEVVRPAKGDDVSTFWSAAAGGGGIFLGSGSGGDLWKLAGGKLSKVADTDAMVLTDLAVDGGTVYAASIPDGKIFKINGGKVETFTDLTEEHIWALVRDPKSGKMYAGVGPGAKVYEIDKAGKAKLYYDAEDQHVTALALHPKTGKVYAGTSNTALVLEITAAGKARAVADFDGEEIGDLVFVGDDLYVTVNDLGDAKETAKKAEDRDKPKGTSSTPRPSSKKGGKIFKVTARGAVESIYETKKGYFTSMAVDGASRVYAGDGESGKVIRIDSDTAVGTVFDFDERQVRAMILTGAVPVIATGDAAAVYKVSAGPAKKAHVLSDVFDAKAPSEWGMAYVMATGRVSVRTRSGNTSKPDATWSGWSKPLSFAALGKGAKVASDSATYLQFRVDFDDGKANLHRVDVYYRPLNTRAVIEEITALPDGVKAPKGPEAVDAVDKASSEMKISWKVKNPDDDELRYKLSFRSEGDTSWLELNDGKPVDKTEYKWETDSIPDGYYEVRVEGLDDLTNPAADVLPAVRVSEPIIVDNTPPSMRDLRVAFPVVSGTADDSFATIARIDYSVDGADWVYVGPSDRVFDSPREPFKFTIAGEMRAGKHVITVRARDAAGNIGAGKTSFMVGGAAAGKKGKKK